MARHLELHQIPEAAKTVRVDVYSKVEGSDADGEPARYEKTGSRNVQATYFWQTLDGSRFIGQATARERDMFKFDADNPPATIQVNKYGMDGTFLGGPWTVKEE